MINNAIEITKLLANQNKIKPGVSVTAKIDVKGFGNVNMSAVKDGVITKVEDSGVKIMFENLQQKYTKFEDILKIEGMDIVRYAQAYKIKLNPKKK